MLLQQGKHIRFVNFSIWLLQKLAWTGTSTWKLISGIFGPQGRDKWYEALPRPENASECERWAKEIVAFLSQHSDEDLLRIRGIGPKRLEELREFERRAA